MRGKVSALVGKSAWGSAGSPTLGPWGPPWHGGGIPGDQKPSAASPWLLLTATDSHDIFIVPHCHSEQGSDYTEWTPPVTSIRQNKNKYKKMKKKKKLENNIFQTASYKKKWTKGWSLIKKEKNWGDILCFCLSSVLIIRVLATIPLQSMVYDTSIVTLCCCMYYSGYHQLMIISPIGHYITN